ncbi:MAG TPA: hypothetical protein VJH69_02090 [Candidatus Paceibacterota bacterium]
MGPYRRGSKVVDLRKRRVGATMRATVPIFFPRERKSPLRARRRKLRALAAISFVVLAIGALSGASALTYLPRYSITDISVTGAKTVSTELIRAYVHTKLYDGETHFASMQNIFLYPKDEIEKGIPEEIPRIRSAEIFREGMLARVVTVKLTEREPFALWCAESECYLMDEGGFIFAKATSTINLPLAFRGGVSSEKKVIGQKYLPEYLPQILELFSRLREAGFAPTGATAVDEHDYSISLREGFIINAAFENEPAELIRNLQVALTAEPVRGKSDKLEYIDMRFGNRVYYKFK